MDLATIIGFVVGMACIIGGIVVGGDIMAFIDIPSILIVVGGVLAAPFTVRGLS